ncbi:MAG: hypothetical protein HOM14_02445 [Gammaproteobacteria bacterium]|nr:hypothetical protein [Gammaproteobacteria bacterium]MBT3724753.1 hypothetical protein [Gammaproteobacteria bacterium]MBT4195498.1 hypothetical protein [Gammaproteobacteria bacterium]MBT4448780.1 hypothetical protein [Gammaproteobacteria bacterium]MBT4860632.1 hypothetical protein [Gammaproteobacteria bacterium]
MNLITQHTLISKQAFAVAVGSIWPVVICHAHLYSNYETVMLSNQDFGM